MRKTLTGMMNECSDVCVNQLSKLFGSITIGSEFFFSLLSISFHFIIVKKYDDGSFCVSFIHSQFFFLCFQTTTRTNRLI